MLLRNLNVILVEDERELCEEFGRCFETTEGLELLASTGSEAEALELVRCLQPDVVILDLELHMGEGNGVTFLSKVSRLKGVRKPFIVVNTNNSSQVMRSIVRNLGADSIISKHQLGYSPAFVAEFLLTIAPGLIESAGEKVGASDTQDDEENDRNELRERILDELNKVSISPKKKGYIYLADAIEICCNGYVKKIAVVLSEKYGKSPKSIEHAMQNAIESAWDNTDLDEQAKHYKARYSANRLSPTVKEFICYYAAKFGNDG